MKFLFAALVGLVCSAHAQSVLTLNINASTGDTISGEKEFKVTVNSADAINSVEFYLGDDLRQTETSTPYTFPLDTVDMPDGDINIRFKAYTVQNKTAEKSLTVHVDNQKSKGADFHVQAAQDALSDSNFKLAIVQGRIALSVDPQSEGAKIVLARANLGLKVLDKAQLFAEDAVSEDPKSSAALQILASINAQRAFSTFAKLGADQSEIVSTIGDAFKGAVDAEKKSLDLAVDAVGAPTDANVVQLADAANLAERYSLTISTLQKLVEHDASNLKLVDRLVYAQTRSGKYQDALNTFALAKDKGKLDAYGDAVLAVVLLQVGKKADAEAALNDAIEADPDNLGVRTAQAFFDLKQNKAGKLANVAADLAKDQGQRVSVNYFLMCVLYRQGNYAESRKAFERGVLAEPSYPDLYIEQANIALAPAFDKNADSAEKGRREDLARMYFQTALVARPEASDALAGLCLVSILKGEKPDAIKYATASRDAAPDVAIGHFALAAALAVSGRSAEARTELDLAAKLDPISLGSRGIPNAAQVWNYLEIGGRIPVLAMPQ